MNKTVKTTVSKVKTTNNTQNVARKLIMADGQWVSRKDLERVASSAAARVRDLRKAEFGRFQVECKSAAALKKTGKRTDYFYRIPSQSVTTQKVKAVFRMT